jgi:hypothetical protein
MRTQAAAVKRKAARQAWQLTRQSDAASDVGARTPALPFVGAGRGLFSGGHSLLHERIRIPHYDVDRQPWPALDGGGNDVAAESP